MRVLLTLNHFTLPIWIRGPLAVRSAFTGSALPTPCRTACATPAG